MKSYLFCLFFAAVFFVSCAEQEKKDVQMYLDAVFRLYQERFEDTDAIAALLTEGLTA
jgi:hypothetical protein